MFKTTVTAWLVRLAITWVGAGVISFLVADYVLRVNVEAVGAGLGGVSAGIERLEGAATAQAAEIGALRAQVEAQAAAMEPGAAPEAGEAADTAGETPEAGEAEAPAAEADETPDAGEAESPAVEDAGEAPDATEAPASE